MERKVHGGNHGGCTTYAGVDSPGGGGGGNHGGCTTDAGVDSPGGGGGNHGI